MTDNQKEREAFETWFSDQGQYPKAIQRRDDGYLLSTAQSAWDTWQARAAIDAALAARGAVPAGMVLVNAGALQMVINALRRDAEQGRSVRGEMADELFAAPQQVAQPVQPSDSTLPERDSTKPAEQQGVFRKFDVQRVDGSSAPGGKHHGCEYFVLDVDHDPIARAALSAYADAVEATHPVLAADMRGRYDLTVAQAKAVPLTELQRLSMEELEAIFHCGGDVYTNVQSALAAKNGMELADAPAEKGGQ